MKLWSPRPETNASMDPTGDQARLPWLPRALNNWMGLAVESASDAVQTSPLRRNATTSPLGDTVGDEPSASFRGVPFASETIQMACSAPSGSLVGLGISPERLGGPPRPCIRLAPPGVECRVDNSWP